MTSCSVKSILALAIYALLASLCPAESDDRVEAAGLFREANALYGQGKYAEAAEAYRGIADRGFSGAALYYNLGNAYFKQGVLGRAVLNYRRAWKLSPGDPEIAKNLEYALENVRDDLAALPLPIWERARLLIVRQLPLGAWIALASSLYFLAGGVVLLSLLVPSLRRPAGTVLKVLLVLLLTSALCAALAYAYYRTPRAVIVEREVEVRYGPQEKDAVAFALHEGSEVRVVREDRSGWVQISLPDGKSGWVNATAAEKI